MAKKRKGRTNILLTVIIVIIAIALVIVFVMFRKNKNNKNQFEDTKSSSSVSNDTSDETDFEYIEPIDAEKYLNEIGKVQKKYDASSSEAVMTEKSLINMLSERGFDEYPVETSYTIDGQYYDAKEISQDSSEKHPIYETYFASSDDSVWSVSVINGSIYANSLSYNFQENLEVPVMLSETEYIISYDNVTNQFFEVIPDPSEIIVKVVPKIDAELLESLTIEEIDKL